MAVASTTLVFYTLLCCGDIQINPGPAGVYESKDLSVFYANARSIVNKTTKLQLEIKASSFDVIVLTETHLDSTITDAEIFGSEYSVCRRDRLQGGRFGGGVLIATKEHIKASLRENSSQSELLYIDIVTVNSRKITMGVLYRPPNSNIKVLEDLKSSLINVQTTDIVLLGDFNLSEFDWNNNRSLKDSEHHTLLMDIIHDNFMHQLIKEPTRDQNILDLVLTTNVDLISDVEIGEPFSDHRSITFTLNTAPYQVRGSKKYKYAFNKADWNHLKQLFRNSPWDLAMSDDDINDNWTKWKDIFFAAVNDCIPKFKERKRISMPWITKDLIKLSRKKRNLYRKAKRSGKEETWSAYRLLNNSLKRNCNSAKWQYLNDLADKLKQDNNPKPFWNYIKSKRKGTNDLVLLKEDGNEITEIMV